MVSTYEWTPMSEQSVDLVPNLVRFRKSNMANLMASIPAWRRVGIDTYDQMTAARLRAEVDLRREHGQAVRQDAEGAAETEVAHAAVSARVGIHGEQPTRWLPRARAEFTRRPTPCLSAATPRRKTRFARVLDETRDFGRLKRSPMCETQRTMHTANAGSGARLGQSVDTATGKTLRSESRRQAMGFTRRGHRNPARVDGTQKTGNGLSGSTHPVGGWALESVAASRLWIAQVGTTIVSRR
jgi:hypothetical protein